MIHLAPHQIWTFGPSDVIAPNYVQASIGSDALAGMDFDGVIMEDDSIEDVELVLVANISGETEPTISTTEVDDGKRIAKLQISFVSATDSTYTVSVRVITLRGFTYVRKGRLVVT